MTAKTWLPSAPIGLPASATTAFVAAWIDEFRQAMLEIGLVQTDDTGQFDPGTFVYTHPTAGNGSPDEYTYLMFAFDDELQDVAPIYVRVGFARVGGWAASYGRAPASTVQVGTGTNGAGVLAGKTTQVVSTYAMQGTNNWNHNLTASGLQSYAAFNPAKGFLGVIYSPGARFCSDVDYRVSVVSFFVERVPNALGQPTGDGFSLWANPSNYASSGGAFGSSQAYPGVTTAHVQTVMTSGDFSSGSLSHSVPYNDASSLLTAEGDLYLNHAYHITPHPVRSVGLAAIASGHGVSKGTQIEFTPYGTEPSNFVVMDWTPSFRLCAATTNANPVFLFE